MKSFDLLSNHGELDNGSVDFSNEISARKWEMGFGGSKNVIFSNPPILNIFYQNFKDWSLGS